MFPIDARERSDATKLFFPKDSRTKQSFKQECDINTIMAKYEKTGVIEHTKSFAGHYGDFSDIKSYQEALDAVIAAEEMFMGLPAQARAKFANDPGKFLDFVEDPSNVEEMGRLGLLNAPFVEAGSPAKESEQSST